MIEMILVNIKSISIFVIFLGTLVFVHEWGHFIAAKKLGIGVEKFALGFGPKLWSIMHNGTEFLLCLFPLGGYVKLVGDDKTQCTGTKGEFCTAPVWKRALVVFNGPFVNIIFAYLCLVLVFMVGYPEFSTKVGDLVKDYPAQAAGILKGDRIVTVSGQPVESWTDMTDKIRATTTDKIDVTVQRGEKNISTQIKPLIEKMPNLFGDVKEVRMIGIVQDEEFINLKYGFSTAVVKGFDEMVNITAMTYKALYRMAVGSMAAKKAVGGPILIFMIIKNAAEMGFNHIILLLGIISMNLAIFNLLPIIPLDGGHLFCMGIEKLQKKELSKDFDNLVSKIGLAFVMCLFLFVFYNDFDRMGWIEKIMGIFGK